MGTIWPVFSLLLRIFQVASYRPKGYLEARLGITRLHFLLRLFRLLLSMVSLIRSFTDSAWLFSVGWVQLQCAVKTSSSCFLWTRLTLDIIPNEFWYLSPHSILSCVIAAGGNTFSSYVCRVCSLTLCCYKRISL